MSDDDPGRPAPSATPDGRPRRVAVVSDAVLPWHQGGKEQRHHELCRRLSDLGFEVTVYTMQWWDGPRRTRVDGIDHVALCRHRPLYHGGRRSITQALVFALSCLRLVGHRFDVVEADAIPFLPLLPVRLVTWVRRKPMVTTWHEFWGRDYWATYLGWRGRLAAAVEAGAVRLPDRIIAASEETAGRLRDAPRGPRDVVVVPNGVASPGDPAAASRAPRPSHRRPRLLVAGRLLENKRVDLAVGAVAVLRERGLDVTLQVVGEGPERPGLERLVADRGLGAHVTFTPFLDDHADVLELMAEADVLLSTSVREGFGMVALEAMSVGTPVVTTDHPDNAARHLVRPGRNGHLAHVDAASVADAVQAVLAHRDELAVGALETAADYDWDRLVYLVAAAYGGGSADAVERSGQGVQTRRTSA